MWCDAFLVAGVSSQTRRGNERVLRRQTAFEILHEMVLRVHTIQFLHYFRLGAIYVHTYCMQSNQHNAYFIFLRARHLRRHYRIESKEKKAVGVFSFNREDTLT